METLRDLALAVRDVEIRDGKDNAVWPGIERYVLAWQFWYEADLRQAIRDADTATAAQAIAEATTPNYGNDDVREQFGGPHMYWGSIEEKLWKRGVFECARQSDDFRVALVAAGRIEGEAHDHLDAALAFVQRVYQQATLDELETWMLPPWLELPWIGRGSMGWRMGSGETYGRMHYEWRRNLTPDEASRYHHAFGDTALGSAAINHAIANRK